MFVSSFARLVAAGVIYGLLLMSASMLCQGTQELDHESLETLLASGMHVVFPVKCLFFVLQECECCASLFRVRPYT